MWWTIAFMRGKSKNKRGGGPFCFSRVRRGERLAACADALDARRRGLQQTAGGGSAVRRMCVLAGCLLLLLAGCAPQTEYTHTFFAMDTVCSLRLPQKGEQEEMCIRDSSYIVRVWTSSANCWDVQFSLTEAIRDAFERHGVTMTYNHLNVHLIEKEGAGEGRRETER